MTHKASTPQILIAITFVTMIGSVAAATALKAMNSFLNSNTHASISQEAQASPINNSGETTASGTISKNGRFFQIKRMVDNIYAYRDNLEKKVNEKIFGKLWFVDIFGLVQRIMGKQFVQTKEFEIFKDSDKKLNMVNFLDSDEDSETFSHDLDDLINNLGTFKEQTDTLNIPLLFVIVPPRIFEGHTRLPIGIEESIMEKSLFVIDSLEKLHIDYIDLERELLLDNYPLDQVHYKTDHHWTIQTSFWAYKKVVHKLINGYGFDFDPRYEEISNFRLIGFEPGFLGSIGNRVGRFFVGIDDFSYLEPVFNTSYTISKDDYHYNNTTKSGSFSDVILDKSMLSDENGNDQINRYAVYHGGDWPQEVIVNHNETKYKILILKDSFALPVAAFLSLNFHQMQIIDLRWYKHDRSITSLVKDFRPDIILFIYKPSSLFYKNYRSELVLKLD